jgi:polysaccharide biosynthesis transport protein
MNFSDLVRVLLSRKLLFCGIVFTIVGTGMIVTFLLPPTYESSMKILVSRDRIDPQVSPSEKSFDQTRSEFTDEEFNSEIEILRSRTVLEGVVWQFGLDKESHDGKLQKLKNSLTNLYRSFHQQTEPSPTERAVTWLSDSLDVFSIKKSRIIMVTYRNASPELASQVLDELYRQFAEHHLRMRQNSKTASVFREQSEAFNRRLNESTEALKRFDVKNSAGASASQRDMLARQYYEVKSDLDKTRTEIRETRQRIIALKSQLSAQPVRIESESRTRYVAARDKIKDEILVLELQRTHYLQKYQPDHRLVKEVEERLAQARTLLAREEQSPPAEQTTVLNDVHRRLTNELLTGEANLTMLREREQSMAALVNQYRGLITRFDMKSLERADLERVRAVNEEAYLLYHKKAQEADIVNALNQERIVNFSLADAPSPNHKPVSPKPLVNFAILVVVGLMAGIASVTFLERNRLHSAETRLLATSRAAPLPMSDDNPALSHQQTMLDEQSDKSQVMVPMVFAGGDHRHLTGEDEAQITRRRRTRPYRDDEKVADEDSVSKLDSSDGQNQNLSTENDSVQNDLPEDWQVEAAADYLHRVYRMSPEKLSDFLRKTAGWEVSPAEIARLLSNGFSPQPSDGRERKEAIPDSQTD